MRACASFALPVPSMMVQSSLPTTTFFALPSSLVPTDSRLMPRSSNTALPPVTMARSSSIALRRSPKPGAFTAQHLNVPRSLFTTSVASASPSMSSATISSGRPLCAIFSSSGSMSLMLEIFFSWIRIHGFSSTASILSWLVTKCGDR